MSTVPPPTIPASGVEEVCGWVLALVEDALLRCGSEPLTRAHVAAGAVAWDDCCGTLVVAPERIYRTARFPTEGPDEMGCFDGLIAVDLVVLLLRCVPTLDDRGRVPTVASMDAAYRAIMAEAAVVWNTLRGPFAPWETANQRQEFVGSEGGCIGVETRITVGVEEESWCPDCPGA